MATILVCDRCGERDALTARHAGNGQPVRVELCHPCAMIAIEKLSTPGATLHTILEEGFAPLAHGESPVERPAPPPPPPAEPRSAAQQDNDRHAALMSLHGGTPIFVVTPGITLPKLPATIAYGADKETIEVLEACVGRPGHYFAKKVG